MDADESPHVGRAGVAFLQRVQGPRSLLTHSTLVPTGNTVYVLDEIYESEAGVTNHWTISQDFPDMGAVLAWADKAQVTTQHRGRVINSLV